MRITVSADTDGSQISFAVQSIDASTVLSGDVNRSSLVDVDKLLKQFSHLDENIVASLSARLRVFCVTHLPTIAKGEACKAETKHVIRPEGPPRMVTKDFAVQKGDLVATFALNDVTTVRHEIEPELVLATIEAKILDHEKLRIHFTEQQTAMVANHERLQALGQSKGPVPEGPEHVDPMIDGWIARERGEYARVRIIEMKGRCAPDKPFFLVYGDQPDDASGEKCGGFDDLERARDWFLKQGR